MYVLYYNKLVTLLVILRPSQASLFPAFCLPRHAARLDVRLSIACRVFFFFVILLVCGRGCVPTGPPSMADVFVELRRLWKDLCRESGVIFNFLLGQNGDTLFAGAYLLFCFMCCVVHGTIGLPLRVLLHLHSVSDCQLWLMLWFCICRV